MKTFSTYIKEADLTAADIKKIAKDAAEKEAKDTAKDVAKDTAEKEAKDVAKDTAEDAAKKEANKSIKDEKSFREAAKKKFETVFGDKVDVDKMNDIIDGLLEKNKDLVENGDWGELIGMLNKSFGH